MMNNCKYNPSGKHECTHQHYCIFNNKRNELEHRILQVHKKLEEFKHIKHCFINDEIIYHKNLKDCYIIEKGESTRTDGLTHYKVGVKVTDDFMKMLNRNIDNLKYDLKNLERFKMNVIHGRVDGYGNGDL